MKFPVYVLHVKSGFSDREESIVLQFRELEIPFEWVLDFDIPELETEVLNRFQNPQHHLRKDEISCCLKHINAWKRLCQSGAPGGIIFEDDVILDRIKFHAVLDSAIDEFLALNSDLGCICLGDGCAMHVPWTKTRQGVHLYRAGLMRASDSYWITSKTAILMGRWASQNGFGLPADHLIAKILNEMEIPLYWLEPTIVTQGSHCGFFRSIIHLKDTGIMNKKYEFLIKKIRRKYIYPLFGVDPRFK